MVSKSIWVGIIVGVFFVAIGISAIYLAASNSNDSNSQIVTEEKIPESSLPPPTVTQDETGSIEFDPEVIEAAKENIPKMQEIPKVILIECRGVNSYSDYQTFMAALAVIEQDLLDNVYSIDTVLTLLESDGYDKHPEVGLLIKETRLLSEASGDCLDGLYRKYG